MLSVERGTGHAPRRPVSSGVAPQTGSRRARQQHDRHPADGAAETGCFPRTQRHAMDREFTRLGERSSRVIVDSRPSPTDDKDNIDAGFDQRTPDDHQVTLDRDAFSDDTPVALDRSAGHRPIAVLPCAGLRLSNQYPHTRPADDRDL